jgi:hypothetical protein
MSTDSPMTDPIDALIILLVSMDNFRCEGELLDEVGLVELDVVLVEEDGCRIVLLPDNCVALGFAAGGPEGRGG